MQKKQAPHIKKWLLPLSWVYGFIVFIRRKLFDWNILKREKFDIPVICVGNITVGGTGKTPHIEYLIRLFLKNKYRIAVLSRGYKRKTKGFVLATHDSTYQDIGDESFQIKNKFPDVIVAVDEKRARGIKQLLNLSDKPDIILLDDALQHLYVKPSFTIVLTDYNRPIYEDTLLPAGLLREPLSNLEQANVVIVTKCPRDLKPIDLRILSHDLNVFPYQSLLFTTIEYGNLISLFNHTDLFNVEEMPLEWMQGKKVLLVTGIASPKNIIFEVKKYASEIETLVFPDHHDFSSEDIKKIEIKFNEFANTDTITLVTEKDAVRLINRKNLSVELKKSLYYLPIRINFLNNEETIMFNQKLLTHVRENSRNS